MPVPAILYAHRCESPVSQPIRLGDFITRLSIEPGNRVEVSHPRDRRKKKSPGVSSSIGGDQILRHRRIKSPGVSPA